ncbi:MAG TPA: sigma-54 dependent transcriptional regulator [Pyrinomonadaceae bacterium]|jgi:DNA-binding NtrC family response regulator|nr:sigma-54 dependent transcriptional regulator [Pyrinomonadaceae bacterium]
MTEQAEQKTTVLVVDDDRLLRRQLYWALAARHRVLEAETRAEAVDILRRERVDVVISDLHLPPDLDGIKEGLAIVEAARGERPSVPAIVITASDNKQAALEAVRRGAYGFFQKPFDEEEVSHIVTQAARLRRLEAEVLRLRSELQLFSGFGRFVGTSAALESVLKQARAVADTNATVLITGENGTGKEVLARAVHEESTRRDGPFVAVSCAALPEQLIESELFGHVKGAFTDAKTDRAGRFEVADGGTLFLDEIGELSQAVQVKLLRVIEQREIQRLGSNDTVQVNIRLLTATNRDLELEVAEKRFREDLFYRLNVVPLLLPPLRDRREDIPLLATHFAAKAADKHNRPTPDLDPALVEALQEYEWPGNVRELENLIERFVVLTGGPRLGVESLPEKMLHVRPEADASASAEDETTLEGATIALRRRMVIEALKAEGGNRGAAAKRLRISRSYIHRLITELSITDV